MPKEPFMLVSLKGDKAKKLAQVMANPTCTKILEYLAGKDATETQIAAEMKIPLSTVHYNLQQLVEAKLVLAEEFHYSEKGREVNHYKLANKYIIIAPQEDDPTFLARLRKFVPITIIVLATGAVLKTMQFFTGSLAAGSGALESTAAMKAAAPLPAQYAADNAVGGAMPAAAPRLMAATAPQAMNATANQTAQASNPELARQAVNGPMGGAPHLPWWQSSTIDYFLLGAFFVLLVLVIAEAISYWRWKRKQE